MSHFQIKNEVENLIFFSGHSADKRMQCSLLRIMMMRHPGLNARMANEVIAECLKGRL